MVLTQVIIKPIKIVEVNFPQVSIVVGKNVPITIQTYGKLTWF